MYARTFVPVDSIAPDFTLKDENNEDVSLRTFTRGKKYVVLVFIRGVDDKHTRAQLDYLKDDYQRFCYFEADVLAVSYGSVDFNRKLTSELSLPFHVLSDDGCSTIEQFGLYNQYDKMIGPAIFVLNSAGTVLFMYAGKTPADIVEDEEIINVLRGATQCGPNWPVGH